MGIKGNRRKKGNLSRIERADDKILKEILSSNYYYNTKDNKSIRIKEYIEKELSDQIILSFRPLDSEISGYLKKENDHWDMVINKNHHINRQRYTIAHELAHYFLHRDKNNLFEDNKIYFRNMDKDSMEYQADSFAAKLLMPELIFKQTINSGVKNIDKLSKIFQVSTTAIINRAEELGYKRRSE